MSPSARPESRVLMIALDSAEPSLVERWMDEGHLPTLARLRDEGSYGRLASSADWLAGSIWPTFHTGTLPGDHALYHFVQWDRKTKSIRRPSTGWLPQTVFWREAARAGRRVVAVDLPSLYAPEPMNGLEISGWCNNDLFVPPASFPPELLRRARVEFGGKRIPDELYAPERPTALLRLRDRLTDWTVRTGDLAVSLMGREKWDLFLVNLTATHRGGHRLWDGTAARGAPSAAEAEALSRALLEVYATCDATVGRLVDRAGPAAVLVFSLHGMGPNTSRVILLPEMLDRVLTGRREPQPRSKLKRLRDLVPAGWRSRVKTRLPMWLQDQLTVFWRVGDLDLDSAAAFPLVADLQGYIRVSVRGRDAGGRVDPGPAYDRLCDTITEGLASFRDVDTGVPIVAEVMRGDRLYPGGTRSADLPDLIVRWSPSPSCEHRAIVSSQFGSIPWPTPGRHVEGRSGNHRGEGFLIASGQRLGRGASLDGAHIVDLAPTVFRLLDLPPRHDWVGRALPVAAEG